MKKRILALIGSICLIPILVALPFMAACEEEVAPPAEEEEEEVIVETPKKLVIAVPYEPGSLDQSIAVQAPAMPILMNITEHLLSLDPNGEIGPSLTTWEISADGLTIECTLREGVKFHSGDPLTTEDIVFSYERASESVGWKSSLRRIDSVEAIDDYHFVIHFLTPDVPLVARGGFPVVSKSYYDRVGEDTFVTQPVGTGPYKFVSYESGYSLNLEANEDYWGEVPSVKEVEFRFITEDTTRVAMLKTGEADIILECPFALLEDVTSTPGLEIVDFHLNHPSPGFQFHCWNPDVPWYDKNVRLAIAYAIDADTIIQTLLVGVPERWPKLADWEVGYDPNLENYPYDPDTARELLATAGYADGFDMPIYYPVGRMGMLKETLEAVVLYLEAVDIRCHPEGLEYLNWWDQMMAVSKQTDAVWVTFTPMAMSGLADPSQMIDMNYNKDGIACLFSTPDLDALAKEAVTLIDDAERADVIRQAMMIVHDNAAAITIWNNVSIYAMQDNIDYTPTIGYGQAMMLIKDVKIE